VQASGLNIVEALFGKMTRTFLRNIRVQSWEELRERILKGIAEINADPVEEVRGVGGRLICICFTETIY
jgi:hypothetical protein